MKTHGAIKLVGAFLLLTISVGCGERKKVPASPELEASRAAFDALVKEPMLKSIGISQQSIVESFGIETPFNDTGDAPIMGHPTLIAFNTRAMIEVRVNGPKDDLRSVSIATPFNGRSVDLGQESQRMMSAFLSKMDAEIWKWIAEEIRKNAKQNFETRSVERTFGKRKFVLKMLPADGDGPATFGVLILPAH